MKIKDENGREDEVEKKNKYLSGAISHTVTRI